MKKKIFNTLLLDAFYTSQKHGQQYKKGRAGVIFLFFTAIILPCLYALLFPRFLEIKEYPVAYLLGIIALFLIFLYLLYYYMGVKDKKMLKALGISVDKRFPDQQDRDEYQEEKVEIFHQQLTDNQLLTEDFEKDIPLIDRYIECLDRERKHWYTNPKLYAGAIFGVLFVQFWHVFLNAVADVSPVEEKIPNLVYCLLLMVLITILGTFVMVAYEGILKITHKKSKDYKNTIRYLNILKDNLIYKAAFKKEEEPEEQPQADTKGSNTLIDFILNFIQKIWQ